MMQPTKHSQEATEADVIEPLSPDEYDDEEEEEEERLSTSKKNSKKSKSNNKRRFSDEQVRSLETIFASETKLEPKKKVQVAKELGLEPRQVAIWFQNKRARWKSKQIEKNYRLLKSNYDSLRSRFDAIKQENESLLKQLQQLRSLLEKSHQECSGCKDSIANSGYISKEEREVGVDIPELKSNSLIYEEMDQQGILYSDDDKSGNMTYLGQDEPEPEPQLMQLNDYIDASSIKWCGFDAGNLFDQSSSNSYWWDS